MASELNIGAGDRFVRRHVGPSVADIGVMLKTLGYGSLDELTDATVPGAIRLGRALELGGGMTEYEVLGRMRELAGKNQVMKSFIGMGYYDTIVPAVIQRSILENPGWYTQYTPYQAEISQGRLEALLNFQTMVADLTGLPLANASLLDEGTAAAEGMAMCHAIAGDEKRNLFFVSAGCHPQTIAVVRARAKAIGVECVVGDEANADFDGDRLCGGLLQYPMTDGRIVDCTPLIERIHAAGGLAVVATDLLALTLIKPPGEMGADIAVGSAQRFGVPMGYGGPHAGFMATKQEHVRKMPGRIVGVSKDAAGNPAYRLTLQTREQHIRRDKATSNICTAQVLLAIMASMYAVYHGPEGLKAIAQRVKELAVRLAMDVADRRVVLLNSVFFDTIYVRPLACSIDDVMKRANAAGILLRRQNESGAGLMGPGIAISLDETTTEADIKQIADLFGKGEGNVQKYTELREKHNAEAIAKGIRDGGPAFEGTFLPRKSAFLTHPVFNSYHCEHEMLRYIKRLESRDLSLCQSMIPLGSCTMKLNAAVEMFPVTWPEFGKMHPFAPAEQAAGYHEMFQELEKWLGEITGFAGVSLQPNAGSQGEFAGLLVIRAYHESRGDKGRNVCLIPTSAHGTNPASAVVAGFEVVPVECDAQGNIDLSDLKKKAIEYAPKLGALMVTYPSTHGVFEEGIKEICAIVHAHGGQVYMDGANMNAQVGLCRPGDMGADVCHLNLHKTFCIPHGGGGPGMGPIGVAKHLVEFLPGHPVTGLGGKKAIGPISAAPYGSASILTISYSYIAMMGAAGLKEATQVAILNANYMAHRLEKFYPVVFKGKNGRCAHEFIIDCRQFEATAGVKVEDIAKRLMDYGFHAPTMSWPEVGTLMIEPTESESKAELDRLCDALIAIREEIQEIEEGRADRVDNALKNAPHTAAAVTADEWGHKYSRQDAAYPAKWLKEYKFWPAVGRIDNPFGDRNLVCTCPPMAEYESK